MKQLATTPIGVENAASNLGRNVAALGWAVTRYGLALTLLWIGAMKFTGYEASGIRPLVDASPVLRWTYSLASVQAVSNAIGIVEIATGLLILARPLAPLLAAIGGAAATATFALTLTFLFTTPGWEPSLGGFPALTAMPGQFLLKDTVLAGASLLVLGEAIGASQSRRRRDASPERGR